MATSKIIYFSAGQTPTTAELAEIADLNALAEPGYSIVVRNDVNDALYGANIEESDFVAGTIPTEYDSVTDYGDIDSDRPLAIQIMQEDQEVAAAATLQLQVIASNGTNSSDITLADVTASTADTTYESDETDYATVSAEGLVTGVAEGEAIITATHEFATDKTISTTVTITVPA